MTHPGPDFVGIGPARTGSSWLYAVLRQLPGYWLPPIKELSYWRQSPPGARLRWHRHLSFRLRSNLAALPVVGRAASNPGRPAPGFDRRYFVGRATDEWYARLFDAAPAGSITGEITPAYLRTPPDRIADLHRLRPDLRVVVTLRDPLDRLWSLATKWARDQGKTAERLGTDRIIEHLATGYESVAVDLARWCDVFGVDQVGIFWFDDFVADPVSYLDAVLEHIGGPGHGAELPDVVRSTVNSSSRGTSGPPATLVEALGAQLAAEGDAIEDLLGPSDHIDLWRARLAAVQGLG